MGNASSRRQEDDELMAAEQQDRVAAECRELREIFELADTDGDGTMSWDEFQAAVRSDERFSAKLEVMGIAMHEAEDVWELLNASEVNVHQFTECMHNMKGDALAKDSFTAVQRVRRINDRINQLNGDMGDYKTYVDRLRSDTSEVRKELATVLHEVQQLVQSAGICIPTAPAPREVHELEALHASVLGRTL